MKHRLIALALSVLMACTLIPTAAAGETADQRLAAVTTKVKAVLNLDTDAYTDFSGNLNDSALAPSWDLRWSGDGIELSISATEEGKILGYYLRQDDDSSRNNALSFPAGSRESAKSAAQSFLRKILTNGESIRMDDTDDDQLNLNTTMYRFNGEVLVNGLSAGMSFSIGVNGGDNQVKNFYRDDLAGSVMGDIPSQDHTIESDAAGKSLRGPLKLKLEYALESENSKRAVLRYLPEPIDQYYVDATTGKLVNLTDLYKDVDENGDRGLMNAATAGGMSEDSAEAEKVPAPSMTEAELGGVEKLEGVLDKAALDAKARAITVLGLDAYTLSTVSYIVPDKDAEGDDAIVKATLRYGRQVNSNPWRRTVVLNAKTGELLRVSSTDWMSTEEAVARTVSKDAARTIAEDFLRAQVGDQFAVTDLYDSSDAMESAGQISHSFQFVRKENGYFFPANSFRVSVDATNGSISSYDPTFDEDITFDSPDGILTMDQALDAWLDTYEVELQYVRVPAAVDYSDPQYAPLENIGVKYLYKLVLGYQLERDGYREGIDAKTGAPVMPSWQKEGDQFAYRDVSGHWAQTQIEQLARYSVGYLGGSFQPDKALTQLDLIALLASTEGYLYDPDEKNAADNLYRYAYDMGILKRSERSDGAVQTRMDVIRMMLDAAGYGSVAKLEGIYQTKFTDESSIPAGSYGYAALAQGLGVVSGDASGQLHPTDSSTRAQAAVMLCNLLAR